MLHYFCVRGSHDIAGFVGTDFWTKTVLRESRDNCIVRAALVALSSLQLEYTTTSSTSGYVTTARAYAAKPETVMQYEKAVRLLRKRLTFSASNASMVKTAIICSVLFYAFETALGHSHTAALHINNGLQMAASYRDSLAVSSIHSDDDLPNLAMILERLDLQACLYDTNRIIAPPLLPEYEDKVAWILQRDVFLGLEDANTALIKIQICLVRFLITFQHCNFELLESIPSCALQQRDILAGQLAMWKDKFARFTSTKDVANDHRTACASATILVQFHICQMLLSGTISPGADMFRQSPNGPASFILHAISQILHLGGQNNHSKTQRSFSLETSVVAPLFMLAMKCSDESVCSKALHLLTSLNRREGPYDAQNMADIITRLENRRRKTVMAESETSSLPLENLLQVNPEGISGGMDCLLSYI